MIVFTFFANYSWIISHRTPDFYYHSKISIPLLSFICYIYNEFPFLSLHYITCQSNAMDDHMERDWACALP